MKYAEFLDTKQVKNLDAGFETPYPLNPALFDFQQDAVKWALRRGRAALFLDCGLGKTLCQLEWAEHIYQHTSQDVLIFAPLAVSMQTQREGEKFGIPVNIAREQSEVIDGINITNYERLHKFNVNHFGGLVLDESAILRSFTGKFRNEIIQQSKDVAFKLCCTATPAPNDHMELGNHAEFLGIMKSAEMLAMFFIHDAGDTTRPWRIKGHAEDAFWKWMASWSVMMRNPADLGYDGSRFVLPPLHYHEHVIKTNHRPEGELFAMEAITLDEQRQAKRDTIGERIEALAEIINGSEEPWLIWCELNDESSALTAAIDGAVEIKGSDSIEHKESAMIAFSEGKIKRLVTKPKIAGHGMNWQNANKMAFVGLSHSFESFYQATRRCWRFGQKKPVDVHIIVSDREMRIVKNIKRKEEAFQRMYKSMIANSKDYARKELKGMTEVKEEYQTHETMGSGWTMINGDCIEELAQLKSESVGFSIFSPPFSSLFAFTDSKRDLANVMSDQQFKEHYGFFAHELSRVVMPGRVVAIHCADVRAMLSKDGYIGLKDLPALIRQVMEAAGFIYHSKITIWKSPVVQVTRTKMVGLLHRQLKKDSARCHVGLPDYVIVMRKPGDNPEPVTHNNQDFPVDEWADIASPVWMNIRQGDTLNRVKEEKDEKHITALQLPVIRRLLRLYSNPDDLILSPFAGIGSEGHEAIKMGRRFHGIELKRSYYDQAVKNLRQAEIDRAQDFLV